jgi:hypothetical protein
LTFWIGGKLPANQICYIGCEGIWCEMSTINWTPIIAPLLSVIGVVAIASLLGFCVIRRLHRAFIMYKFPNRKIPLPKRAFGRNKLYERVTIETDANVNSSYYPDIPPPEGWESINNTIVNYKNFICKTPKMIETAITKFNSTLVKYPNQTFEEYINFVKDQLPSHDREWKIVVNTFEKAEYDSREISPQEYNDFIRALYVLLCSLEHKQ